MYMYILNDFKVITVLFLLLVSVNDSWGCKGVNNHVKIIVWLHICFPSPCSRNEKVAGQKARSERKNLEI